MNSLRLNTRTGRSHTATRSLIVTSAIALAVLILLVGALALLAQPSGARAASPLQAPERSGVAGPAAAPSLSPSPRPALQASTSLTIGIFSTPHATIDHNKPISGPLVWVVEAVITNTGSETATTPLVDLDMNPNVTWDLLPGESSQRTLPSMPPGSTQVVYWFARHAVVVPNPHTYTVTVSADNAPSVSQRFNAYENPSDQTVQARTALDTGSNGIVSTGANVQVGVAFSMSVDYDMGVNPQGVTVQPTGIFTRGGSTVFDPSAYRLLSSTVQFRDSSNTNLGQPITDRLYFPPGSLPGGARFVTTTYTFVALRPANATLCPYTDVRYNSGNKYDNGFCVGNAAVNITGTLTFNFTKSVNASTVRQGQLLTYTLRYTNTGSQSISNLYVWDNIPSQTITSSVSPAPDSTEGFNTITRTVWNIGTITPGSSGQVTLTVLVNGRGADIPDGTPLVNHGFMGIFFNPDAENPAITSTVTTTLQAPTIAIGKSDDETNVIQGQLLTYTLRVTNTGSVAANNLLITDVLPSGVTYSGGAVPAPGGQSGQTLTWTLGSLVGGGGLYTITLPVSVNFGLANGTLLTNSMQAQYSNQDGYTFAVQSASDVDTVLSPILAITKHDFPDPVISGRNVTYTLRITNTGSADATTVLITDVVPISTTYVSCSGGSSCGISAGNVISWAVASIAPTSTALVTFSVQVTTGLVSGSTIVNQDYGVVSAQTAFLAGAPEETTVFNAVAIVNGQAFNDADGDGFPDVGEAGIPGVTVTLPGALQPVTVTNATGQYTFSLETAGPISVSAAIPAGFFSTTPSPVFLTVTLESTTTVNFGYAPVTSTFGVIYGTVFDDGNANRTQDFGENGLSGVTVASTGASNTPDTTNAFGQYALTFPVTGTYIVTEANPLNYVSTTPDSVAQLVNPGNSYPVDFGDFLGIRIQGQVFDDLNVNAVNDSEPGVSSALVTAGSAVTTTGSTGVYTLFVTVQPGQPITLTETDPPGYVSTAANPGAGLIRLDTNMLRLDSPISGTVYPNNDFGDVLATSVVSITGQVFDDANADGLYNDGGVGLPNARVSAASGMFVTTTASGNFTLYGPPGAVITVTETNPPGYVSTNALPGNSAVKVNLDALRVSPLAAGAASANNTFGDVLPANAAIVSGTLFDDANNNGVFDLGEATFSGEQVSISGTLSLITSTNAAGAYAFAVGAGTFLIGSGVPAGFYRTTPEILALDTVTGTTYPNQNFGFSNNTTAATIFGTVFDDFNGNALQDLGETGLPGAVLRLISGTTTVAVYTTTASGAYAFNVAQPGVWTVQETNPPGYYSTSSDRLNVVVALGNSYQVDFGDSNRQDVGSVHGLVFDDANANGVQDANEVGIGGVVITTTDDSGQNVISATTGFFGQYTYGFDFVSQGSHTVHEVDPPGYRSTTPDDVVVFVLLGAAQVVDFGDCLIVTCSSVILGTVFNDANGDGDQDFTELGIPGVTVTLYSGATLIAQTTTGPNGNYTFGVGSGVYRVIETDPPLYHSTTPNEVHLSVVVTPATYIVNFGDSNNAFLSSIFGTVFDDANANSVFDVTEVGIPNVPIRIDGNFSGVPITNVATNYLGQYTFLIDQFTPSNVFTVTETDLPGYVSTTPNVVAQAVAVNTGYSVNFGDLLAPVCAPDAYEALNDNLFSTTGVTLTTSGSPLHNFFSPNDEDWLRVTLKQGDIYTFTTVALGARADTVLALFAPDGVTRLAQSDDLPGSTDHSSQINWVGTANGTHYLRVTQLTPALAGCLTDYSISMTVTPRYPILLPLVMKSYP